MRTVNKCIKSQIIPYLGHGGKDDYLTARNQFANMYIDAVEDYKLAGKKMMENLDSSFLDRGQVFLNGYEARIALVKPLSDAFELHLKSHLDRVEECRKLTAGLKQV